ncbi:DUF3592 domain-containing protein [Streptomyces sp. 71268]|uniref:DUF3592 domain-containing protein n=1 Tax=Streptomyces sp. 71268 TaxID=3002640 RepID=UPI0023F9091B|nr:DUF3592 domain-containing protein [Streptomyces sp. 71268]WEV25712.1 DUF3592 domain-containing protein [Streptomyces sp. 71268]
MSDLSGVDLPDLLAIVLAAGMAGGICLWLKRDDEREADTFRVRGVHTTGTVVGHEVRSVVVDAESGWRHDRRSPVVEFADGEGNVVRFVSTLMTHPSEAVPVNSRVVVIYPPEDPEKAEMADALGNPSAGRLHRSGQFVSSSGGYCGLFFGLFIFLSVLCVMVVPLLL